MGKTAMSKLAEADEFNKIALRIRKRDTESSMALDNLARVKRRSAIKQLKRHPKRKGRKIGRVII